MTDLTDKWKKGETHKGTYYCKSKLDGHRCIASFVSNKDLFDCDYNGTLNKGYWEVLAEVPNYEKWQEKIEENTKLKELLKEWVQFEIEENPNDFTVISERMSELANKTNQALGDDKCQLR